MLEFNSNLYAAQGQMLTKLDGDGDEFTLIAAFQSPITQLVQNGTNLFILIGDSDGYWYININDTESPTDELNAHHGIWWDDKLFVFDSAGACKYAVTPATGSPSFTANGSLKIADNELQEVLNYFDANGNDIIYASTKVGLFAHDTDNAKFLSTALKVPSHPTAGKGAVVWHDACFISAGLNVNKYVAASTASITKMGLDLDDGMPQLRSGEVVKCIEGYNEFFALIDSTYEGSSSRSQVVSYDGRSWRTWWEATADNKNMYSGIVSSVYAYRLWFSTTDGVYYIPLQTNSLMPKKVLGYTYGSAGVHLTPRFDAKTKAFPKLATKLTLFLDDMSANETVAVTYQIDQAQGALTSAWTALVSAQTSDGVNEQAFGTNGVGIEFYDIQFRAALARGGTNTNSPIIKGMVLSYLKLIGRKKAWSFTINTAEAGRVGATPKELYDNLATIIALNTLMPFTFRDGSASGDTYYVMLQPFYGFTPTGAHWTGKFELTLIEP